MRTVIQLYLELSPGGQTGIAHVPDIPGCHFAGATREDLVGRASAEVSRYLDWCAAHGLGDLDARVAAIVKARKKAVAASGPALVLRVAEEKEGDVGRENDAPSALFDRDHESPDDPSIHAHFRVVRAAYEEMARLVNAADERDLAARPGDGSASPAETLDHIGDGLWWLCSRIADDLPEPGADCPAHGLARIQCLIPWAEAWMLSIPAERRADVVVPARFPSRDHAEAWTFGKVCRRQAEHMVDHLGELKRRGDDWLDSEPSREQNRVEL